MMRFLVFRLDRRSYGVRLSQVDRVVRAVEYASLPGAPTVMLGLINVHGAVIPLFNIRIKFGLPEREVEPDDQFIIARTPTRKLALMVDAIGDLIECPADELLSIETVLPDTRMIDGVIRREDGLVLIHDLDRFLSPVEEQAMNEALREQPGHGG